MRLSSQFHPVRDKAGDGFDEPGAILADDRHDERNLHGESVTAAARA